MPAPDLETLFDVETALEDGLQKVIDAALRRLDVRSFTSQQCENLPIPRVDVQADLGAHTGHRHADASGQMWLDAWAARITLGVVTERRPDNKVYHGRLRAKLRVLAQYGSGTLDDRTAFPFHVVTKITEAGTTPTIQTMDDCDVSEVAFDCVVSIHKAAWPAA